MSAPADGNIPAFPHIADVASFRDGVMVKQQVTSGGMTLRQYAAIRLRVPDSGLPWLDAMITRAKRDEFAGQALAGICANSSEVLLRASANEADIRGETRMSQTYARESYEMADAMLAHQAKPEGGK